MSETEPVAQPEKAKPKTVELYCIGGSQDGKIVHVMDSVTSFDTRNDASVIASERYLRQPFRKVGGPRVEFFVLEEMDVAESAMRAVSLYVAAIELRDKGVF